MIVYYFRSPDRLTDVRLAELRQQLPSQQRQIVDAMHTRLHRCEQTAAYIMLCNAVAHSLGEAGGVETAVRAFEEADLTMPQMEFPLWGFGEHGKPYMTNYEGVYFNISHCSKAVAVAVGSREVGVDVEGRRRYSDGLLQRSMSDAEQAEIRESADSEATFARLWTRKEAYFKWLGTGILITRLPHTEDDARRAGCHIDTQYVEEGAFFLSTAFGISS